MAEKFEGLLYVPSSDPNFISGIQRLKDAQLNTMFERLIELNETESGHKGRIKAVEKEIKNRGGNSTEMIAVDKMKNEIETVERLYGDGLPYDKDRLEDTAKFYLAQTAQSLFESGKIFLRLKAHEGHGGFMDSLTRIGVPSSTAHYAMATVIKFGQNFQALGNLGTTKIQMLTVLDEPDIKALVKDGVTGNLSLDDIDRMTTRELREKLREERNKHQQDVDTREKAIKKKEAKINELDEMLRFQKPLTEKEKTEKAIEAKLEELRQKLFTAIQLTRFYFGDAIKIITTATQLEGVTFPMLDKWAKAEYEELAGFNDLFEELDEALNYCNPDKGKRDGKRT
jgi:hypothetical protein